MAAGGRERQALESQLLPELGLLVLVGRRRTFSSKIANDRVE